MEFGKLFCVFNDDSSSLGELLSTIIEEEQKETRRAKEDLNDHIESLRDTNTKLYLELDESVGTLLCGYMDIGLAAGYVIGQMFEMTDPEAVQEINSLKKRLIQEGVIRYIPRKKTPVPPAKEATGASEQ